MGRYFFMNKRLGNKWRVPLDSPHLKDLRKNPKSEFHGLAELSTSNTYDKQMTSTKLNKLFCLRNETSRTKITRGFPFLGCKKQSLHFSLCGQLLCIICFEAKLSPLKQFVVYPLTTFFGRSSNFQTSVLMFNHNCSTWFLFGTPTLRLTFEP